MSTRITTVFVAAVIAFALPGSPARNGSHNNEHTFRSIQYCVPEYDVPSAPSKIYC